ncbi:complex I intermediate-associated protein CIA30 [Phanerochaete sordida]|uniref:Complex I intermediate-associated protein CIA30 n=1 Tax=Phanerochaete sordida TaxID=48140 RepID=A0A9P3GJD6_9APHY|nr:complex I intermediate-associated protein CIA30 [Phanerochaete sordida]
MSRLSQYLNRSSQVLRDGASRVLRMAGADPQSRTPITLWTLNSREDIAQYATGCDADVGGTSSVHLELDERSARPDAGVLALDPPRPHAKFWGEMRLAPRAGFEGKMRGGYAGFRNTHRTSLFGEITDDVSNHRYIALRVRVAGHPRTRNAYFVNIQTDGPVVTDLWQHRLFFAREDGGWEDVFIPFDDFVLTNMGEVQPNQIKMMKERIRTVGISMLGGKFGVEGNYELGIDSIRAVNQEDAMSSIPKADPATNTRWQRQPV